MARSKWGNARVEFLAVWPEVKEQLSRGLSLKSIYDALRDAQRITMSKTAFYENRAAIKREPPASSLRPARAPVASIAPAQVISAPTAALTTVDTQMPTVTHLPGGRRAQIWDDDSDTDTTDAGAISAEGAAASVAPPSVKDTDNAE